MRKLWMLIVLIPLVCFGADNKIVTAPSKSPLPAPTATPVAEAAPGFAIDGPDEIEAGRLLRLRIKGVESKIDPETGLRTPGIQWGVYPASDDMEITTDGYGIDFCSPEGGKSFWFVAAVNNTDPNKAPLMVMKLVYIKPSKVYPKPDPIIPTPDNSTIPNDQFDNVGKLANSVAGTFPLRIETARLYRDVANRLEDGTYPTINSATAECQAGRQALWGSNASTWAAFETAITPTWNKYWANPSKQMVIDFYRCIAKGLDPSGSP